MAKVSSSEKILYQFPAKIRVLAVDNDPTALEFIKNTCNQCKYEVSICTESSLALNLVRERKDCIDVILIEVHMPTMNGYEFLQHASKEIDVPVIVMSLDHSKNTVMKAVQLGACDFWIKPLHDHQFKNMWTHVVRKSLKENKIQKDFVGSLEDDELSRKRGNDNFEFGSSSVVRDQRNNSSREAGDHVGESEHFCSSTKKPRVIWLPDLHSKFVRAVKNLGLNQAVPKKILEEMNVPGLTRENVASHLQKYRDYLKRNSGVTKTQTHEHTEMQLPNTVTDTKEFRVGASSKRHYQTQSGPHPCQAKQALAKCLSNIANNFPQSIRTLADPSVPPSNAVATIQRNNVLVGAMQQSPIHQQSMISGNPASSVSRNIDYVFMSPQFSNPNPFRFVTASISQQLQNSSLTSVAVRSFPASSMSPYGSRPRPGLSLNQEHPNTSASVMSNQNSSRYIVDNTTKEDY